MPSAKPLILATIAAPVAALILAACGSKTPPVSEADGGAGGSDANYLAPPTADAARAGPGGMVLSGLAPGGSTVRLATPAGQAMYAPAGPSGHWTIALPPAAEPRIFGLSASTAGRKAQAEGYLLVTPTGQAAQLRAGAGALRIDPPARPGLRAIDFDRGGGLEVSASVAPRATVILRLDGRQVAEGRADVNGRYVASLGTPTAVRQGAHEVQVFGDGFSDQVTVQISPAAPLAEGPLRSQLTPAGLRVDWMTPGGGVQSTVLVH